MQYISTRGHGPVSFTQTLLEGLAPDGGLYLPEYYPQIEQNDLENMADMTYQQVAFHVMYPYVKEDIPAATFKKMIAEAYQHFDESEVVKLCKIKDGLTVLELFHGPTLAFKDVALQLLGQMFEWVLKQEKRTATVIGATSGDTGPAAIEGVAGLDNVQAFILYPHNRVSEIQRRQMTTVNRANIHPIAIEGTFDDCQKIVKTLLNQQPFAAQVGATSINSISWARLLPQTVYYFYTWSRLYKQWGDKAPTFVVPTGNFGDIFAGYVAKQMGLPVNKLLLASNVNDILTRFVRSGDYSTRPVVATQSPSIDIQIASNFERYIFDLLGRDAQKTENIMLNFAQNGVLEGVSDDILQKVQTTFISQKTTEDETQACIKNVYEQYEYLLDPHSAVAMAAALAHEELNPQVVLATAHPAKFPDAVKQASGVHPALPPHLSDLLEREENFTVLPVSDEKVKDFILKYVK